MTEQQFGIQSNTIDRRSFLKKAGLASGAAAMLWVAPSVVSVGAKPAYAATTGVTTRPCIAAQLICAHFDSSANKTTVHVKVTWDGKDCHNLSHINFDPNDANKDLVWPHGDPEVEEPIEGWEIEDKGSWIKFNNEDGIGDDLSNTCRTFEICWVGDITDCDLTVAQKSGSNPETEVVTLDLSSATSGACPSGATSGGCTVISADF